MAAVQVQRGETGPAGQKGEAGSDGVQGPKGDPGVAGVQGLRGDPGLAGVKGQKGETHASIFIKSIFRGFPYAVGLTGLLIAYDKLTKKDDHGHH